MKLLFILLISFCSLAKVTSLSEIYNISSSCTLTTGNSLDDLTSILSACKEILVKDFAVPAGKTLNLAAQNGSTIIFAGNITFGYREWGDFFIAIKGNNLTVIGVPGNLLDGEGARWWDGLGGNGGKIKPKFIKLQKLKHSIVRDLNIKNAPKTFFSIHTCENVTVTNITMDNSDGDTQGGHNTDGFDTSGSKGVYITNCRIFNQDDCLAVNAGSGHVFKDNYCSGGHGISIGSVRNAVVQNILITNCTLVNSTNGVRIKTVYNTTGTVKNITYENITLENIKDYGITIRGDYGNDGASGLPLPGFEISDITLKNIHGTVQESGRNVFVLLADGVASNWTFEDINIVGGHKTTPECTGLPRDSTFSCADYNGVIL